MADNENQTSKLIELYHERDHLWNISMKEYHDKNKRDLAFQDIAREVQISGKFNIIIHL